VYTARTESLAKLEALVHLKPAMAPRLVLVEATIPDALVATLRGALPAGWNDVPDSGAARSVGDSWLQSGSSLALEVPSVNSSTETNVLINPTHPDLAQLVIGNPVPFSIKAGAHAGPRQKERQESVGRPARQATGVDPVVSESLEWGPQAAPCCVLTVERKGRTNAPRRIVEARCNRAVGRRRGEISHEEALSGHAGSVCVRRAW
jgi:hypothetical protein